VVDYPAELEHDGRAYSLTVPDLEILECESCKTRVLTDEAHKKITYALRKEAGLLLPEEIRAKREALGLTQKQLAALLKIAESTVSRWETGGQIQQRPMDLLLRLFFEVPQVREWLEGTKEPGGIRSDDNGGQVPGIRRTDDPVASGSGST
jgi:putative zinc finger/helix-turn-helix YgiT family protein